MILEELLACKAKGQSSREIFDRILSEIEDVAQRIEWLEHAHGESEATYAEWLNQIKELILIYDGSI